MFLYKSFIYLSNQLDSIQNLDFRFLESIQEILGWAFKIDKTLLKVLVLFQFQSYFHQNYKCCILGKKKYKYKDPKVWLYIVFFFENNYYKDADFGVCRNYMYLIKS